MSDHKTITIEDLKRMKEIFDQQQFMGLEDTYKKHQELLNNAMDEVIKKVLRPLIKREPTKEDTALLNKSKIGNGYSFFYQMQHIGNLIVRYEEFRCSVFFAATPEYEILTNKSL